jgi:hypothetical protein
MIICSIGALLAPCWPACSSILTHTFPSDQAANRSEKKKKKKTSKRYTDKKEADGLRLQSILVALTTHINY